MLRDRFMTDLKEAMKAGDKPRLGTIRLMQAALKEKDIEVPRRRQGSAVRRRDLQLLQKMVKQRQESAKMYTTAAAPSSRAEGECRDRRHRRLSAEADGRGGGEDCHCRGHLGDGRLRVKDMGKVMGELKARLWPDGLRQGEPAGEADSSGERVETHVAGLLDAVGRSSGVASRRRSTALCRRCTFCRLHC